MLVVLISYEPLVEWEPSIRLYPAHAHEDGINFSLYAAQPKCRPSSSEWGAEGGSHGFSDNAHPDRREVAADHFGTSSPKGLHGVCNV